jgi:hypothetical protein
MSNCRKPKNYEEINTNLKKSMIKKSKKLQRKKSKTEECKHDKNSKMRIYYRDHLYTKITKNPTILYQ